MTEIWKPETEDGRWEAGDGSLKFEKLMTIKIQKGWNENSAFFID
jgi:hypothetical protein